MYLPKCAQCQIFKEIKNTGYGWCKASGKATMVRATDPACDRIETR